MKFLVKILDSKTKIEVDPYLEAASQAIKEKLKEEKCSVSVVIEVTHKGFARKSRIYNTYYVLLRASFPEKAELLRQNLLKMHGIDLKNEPISNIN